MFSQLQMNHVYDSAITKNKLTELLNVHKADIWQHSTSNEFGGLAQVNKYNVKAKNTMNFI